MTWWPWTRSSRPEEEAKGRRLRSTEEEARVEVVAGDVTDYATVEGVVDGCDAIITAHAYFGGSRESRRAPACRP